MSDSIKVHCSKCNKVVAHDFIQVTNSGRTLISMDGGGGDYDYWKDCLYKCNQCGNFQTRRTK